MTESISNPIDVFANRMSNLTKFSSEVQPTHLEDAVIFAAHTYQQLNPLGEKLGEKGEQLVKISTLYAEANVLLSQLEQLKDDPSKSKKFNAQLADRRAPLIKKLEEVKNKIDELKDTQAQLRQEFISEKMSSVFQKQDEIAEKLNQAIKHPEEKTEAKEEEKENETIVDKALEGLERPLFIVGQALGAAARLAKFTHLVPAEKTVHAAATDPEVSAQGAKDVYCIGLATSFLGIAYLVPSILNGAINVGKKILHAANWKQQLKELGEKKAALEERIAGLTEVEIGLNSQKNPTSQSRALAERATHERSVLQQELHQVSTQEKNLEEKIKKAPIAAFFSVVPVLGGTVELTGRVLEVVRTFGEHGARIGAGTMAHLSVALQVLGPVASAITAVVSGAVLAAKIKKLRKLQARDKELTAKLADAESRMNPFRREIKKEQRETLHEIAANRLLPAHKKELHTMLDACRMKLQTPEKIEEKIGSIQAELSKPNLSVERTKELKSRQELYSDLLSPEKIKEKIQTVQKELSKSPTSEKRTELEAKLELYNTLQLSAEEIKKEMKDTLHILSANKLTGTKFEKQLKDKLEAQNEMLKNTPSMDGVEEFFELEADQLKVEQMVNNRKLGLIGLAVANSAVLTLGGIFGFAATVGSPGMGVTTSLYGVAIGLFGISLVLSAVYYVKSKRSAKALLKNQFSLEQSQEALGKHAEHIAEGLTQKYTLSQKQKESGDFIVEVPKSSKPATAPQQEIAVGQLQSKREDIDRMWQALTEKNPALNAMPASEKRKPEVLKEAIKNHFSELHARARPVKKPTQKDAEDFQERSEPLAQPPPPTPA